VLLKRFDADVGQQELQAGLVSVLPLAEPVEDVDDGRSGGQQVGGSGERLQGLGRSRRGTQPATDQQPEARLCRTVLPDRCQPAQVVHGGVGAVAGAAGEGDLELAGQPLRERVAQEVVAQLRRVGCDVERLMRANAGQRAGRHVAHDVAAGFAGGEANLGQETQRLRHLWQTDVVDLHILAGGQVSRPLPEVAGDAGQDGQLLAVEPALRDADAQHLHAGQAPHAVDAVLQSQGAEIILRDAAPTAQGDGFCQPIDLGME